MSDELLQFIIADQFLTIRDICEREQNRDLPLPQVVADDLFALFHRASDADLHVDLKKSETYSTGAKCLPEFLGRRERHTATMRSDARPYTSYKHQATSGGKMTSKQIALVVGAVLFTVINLLVVAANWSITAHAKVAGMDFSRLEVDEDFRRAIRDVMSQADQSYWRRNSAFRAAVEEVVEGCRLPYRGSMSLRCRLHSL